MGVMPIHVPRNAKDCQQLSEAMRNTCKGFSLRISPRNQFCQYPGFGPLASTTTRKSIPIPLIHRLWSFVIASLENYKPIYDKSECFILLDFLSLGLFSYMLQSPLLQESPRSCCRGQAVISGEIRQIGMGWMDSSEFSWVITANENNNVTIFYKQKGLEGADVSIIFVDLFYALT